MELVIVKVEVGVGYFHVSVLGGHFVAAGHTILNGLFLKEQKLILVNSKLAL